LTRKHGIFMNHEKYSQLKPTENCLNIDLQPKNSIIYKGLHTL
jgi:hypothetical protein